MRKLKVIFFLLIGIISLPLSAFAGTNLADGASAIANSYYNGYIATYITNGDYDDYWNAGDHGYSSDQNWVYVDLGSIFNINRVKLVGGYNSPTATYPYPNFRNIFNLYSSTDGVNWSFLYSGTLYDNSLTRFDDRTFSALTARYVKYEEVGGDRFSAVPPEWDIHWSNLSEMEVYGIDSLVPEPATISLLGLGLLGILGLRKKH